VSLQVLGWVSLITVASVSFYFAKQSINERRRQQDLTGERPSAKSDCECFKHTFFFITLLMGGAPIFSPATGRERVTRDEGQTQTAQALRKKSQ